MKLLFLLYRKDCTALQGKSRNGNGGKKIARQKTGMENRRQGLKDIKSLFSPIVIIRIIKFVEKIIRIQKVIIAHMADLFRCHAFRGMFDILFPKFLCKFSFCDSFNCDRLPFRIRYLDYTTKRETIEENKRKQGNGTDAFA